MNDINNLEAKNISKGATATNPPQAKLTQTEIQKIKKQAKLISKQLSLPYMISLDHVCYERGLGTWNEALENQGLDREIQTSTPGGRVSAGLLQDTTMEGLSAEQPEILRLKAELAQVKTRYELLEATVKRLRIDTEILNSPSASGDNHIPAFWVGVALNMLKITIDEQQVQAIKVHLSDKGIEEARKLALSIIKAHPMRESVDNSN